MSDLFPSIFSRDPFFTREPTLFRFPNFLQEFEQFQNEKNEHGLTIYDENNSIVVEAAMPGLRPEEISVNLNKGVLWVKGEKKEEESNKDKKFYRKSLRSFSYSVALPEQVDENQTLEANYEDGILKIKFQKAKPSEAKRIAVKGKK